MVIDERVTRLRNNGTRLTHSRLLIPDSAVRLLPAKALVSHRVRGSVFWGVMFPGLLSLTTYDVHRRAPPEGALGPLFVRDLVYVGHGASRGKRRLRCRDGRDLCATVQVRTAFRKQELAQVVMHLRGIGADHLSCRPVNALL
jgi:hypothetical protein